jgi:hypothetical protein
MFQHPGRDDLDRIERAAGHFEEADLKGERNRFSTVRRRRTAASSFSLSEKKC